MTDKGKIKTKEGLEILANNIPAILFTVISGLVAVNPVWSVLFATSTALISAWGSFGQARVNELVSFMDVHKEEFMSDVIESDNFKTLFLNILERHMKESSEDKRKLLRNYLLSAGRGVNPNFNEFTKMNNIMDTITLSEIKFLQLWDDDEPIGHYLKINNPRPGSLTLSDIQSIIFRMMPRDSKYMSMVRLSDDGQNNLLHAKNTQILLSLIYKGLLFGLAQDNFGSGQEVRIKEITDFGKAFLNFIKE